MRHVTGYFANQFFAAAVVDKLLAHGMPRDHILVVTDESVGNSPASSNAPANVISNVSHLGHSGSRDTTEAEISPERNMSSDNPADLGHFAVTVIEDAEWTETILRDFLANGGARRVATGSDPIPVENTWAWPAATEGSAIDVERAIAASRGGK